MKNSITINGFTFKLNKEYEGVYECRGAEVDGLPEPKLGEAAEILAERIGGSYEPSEKGWAEVVF